MNSDEMFDAVKRASGASELSEVVAIYRGYRPNPSGGTREITIEVRDSHDPSDEYRWYVEATDELGIKTRGNGERTLDLALVTTQWKQLNRDAPDPATGD